MAGHAAELDLDRKRLKRRLGFLQGRVRWHDLQIASERDLKRADLHIACAATLERDAAAIAMLLGEIQQARLQLFSSGRRWLDLGLFVGSYLMRLGGSDRGPAAETTAWIPAAIFKADGPDQQPADDERPFARSAARDPRQLLSIVQGCIGVESPLLGAASGARERLSAFWGLPLGTAGTPLGHYIRVLDELQTGNLGEGGRETLTGMAIRRRELIDVARQDGFHWRRLHHPVELIDFDLLALGLAAQAGGEEVRQQAFAIMAERGAASRLPFELARELEEGATGNESDT